MKNYKTLKMFNKDLQSQEPSLTLYKGSGYFYFNCSDNVDTPDLIFTPFVTDLTSDDIEYAVNQYRENKKNYELGQERLKETGYFKTGIISLRA